MMALTVWQPWASLIAIGAKPFEFRGWAAPKGVRGLRIAIHAGARPVKPNEVRALLIKLRGSASWECALVAEPALALLDKLLLNPTLAPLSHVLCTAVLGEPVSAEKIMHRFGGPVENDSDRNAHFNFAWPLTEVEPLLPPLPARGAQGFWEWKA